MQNQSNIVVLSGGVGGARFLEGLAQVIPQENIFVIGNTGDDKEFYGLHVSPDLDTVMYTLSGVVNQKQGWGLAHETYSVMRQLTKLGNEHWFQLGDKDLATHIHRTNLLKQGKTLSEIAAELCKVFGLQIKLVPMSNQSMQTHIQTSRGLLHFEEYFVKNKAMDEVQDIVYVGSENARPSPGILEAIAQARIIILAPSNPLVSIGSIVSVPGIQDALKKTKATIAAISPIVGGMPIKGPADKLMIGMNMEVSALGVARHYVNFVDIFVIDIADENLAKEIEKLDMKVIVTNTIMKDIKTKTELAKTVIDAVLFPSTF